MIFKTNNHRKWLATAYIVAFFLLELLVLTNGSIVTSIDGGAQNLLGGLVSPFNTKLFSLITTLASPAMDAIYLIVIAIFLYRSGKKDAGLWIGFILISGNIISYLVKITVKRPRPTAKLLPASGYSFPSGHVFGTSLVILALIIFILPMIRNASTQQVIKILLVIWLIIVAISRVYLRGHYLSDVLGSALLAGAWWECSELLYLRYYDSIANLLKLNNAED